MLSVQYYVTKKLLNRYLRLGDAVWQTLGQQITNSFSGSAEVATALYGDPTLSYWGNPGGKSTLAAWPMLRFDPRGQGYTPLAGPEVPEKLWEYSANAPSMATLPPSPVVSNNGEVIVAHGSYVDVLRQGTLYERLHLDAAAFGTPAIAADGTMYALDVNGTLYAFPCKTKIVFPYPIPIPAGGATTQSTEATSALGRYRRWALPLGSPPRTSPVVGADGFIAVGTSGMIQLVRPDGVVHKQQFVLGQPTGAPVVGANRRVYVATTGGYIGELDFFCPSGVCGYGHLASTTTDVLLQRRTDAGLWADVAVLPAGTTAYTDTTVADSTNYAYRIQMLDSEATTPTSRR